MQKLWSELGSTMRSLRVNAGVSLRDVEQRCGRGRGNLSQIERGLARPNRPIVEWYDVAFGGDGLLISLFVEARTGGPSGRALTTSGGVPLPGDAFEVVSTVLGMGELVPPAQTIEVGWTLRNTGQVDWLDRHVTRLGACAGTRLLASPSSGLVPFCRAGDVVPVRVSVKTPAQIGTYAAYWQVTDARGCPMFPGDDPLAVQLVVRT